VNELQRRFSVDWARSKLQYMRSVDDELNLLFEKFARSQEDKPKKKKPKKGAGGSSAASTAEASDNRRRIARDDL